MSTINKNDLSKLTRAYNKAVKENKNTFKFKDDSLLTSYAKYLIEYLKTLKK